MEKSTSVRRKAQDLVRNGQIQRAIEAMDRLLQEGDPDPYDYVFHGDLLIRGKRLEDAIRAFQESVAAYERVGLYRNAIAIGKKILRADPTRARTYQRLGDLYAKEGLAGEAVTHFLAFLDKSGGEVSGEEYTETLERIAELSGPKVEVTLRLAELYVRAGHERRAADLLEEVAQQAEGNGGADIAAILRERAAELIPGEPGGTVEGDVAPAENDAAPEAAQGPEEAGQTVFEIDEPAEEAAETPEEPRAGGFVTSLADEIRAAPTPETKEEK
ncbi:MAG: hypothetical protein GF346_01360, partial [Candidatus Eisenbacteria bacterium]|nr:hypothetical protein [Candidatus Latescibacterota bacterium]MBD3301078.1 hypothetical protein [Candidatus Eisenbacteria bacterium]